MLSTNYLKKRIFHLECILHAESAVIHPETDTLFVADAHFGKSATFRQGGIPIPSGVIQEDLNRLSKLIHNFSIKDIFFLGDLFHSSKNNEWNVFSDWRQEHHQLRMNLIVGNHDILDEESYREAELMVYSEPYDWNGVQLRHHPVDINNHAEIHPYFCGHVHPGVRLVEAGKFSQTLPCYLKSGSMFMLPAFGSFTGLGIIHPQKEDRIFVVAGSVVHEVNH